ncbi:hypothetical protein N9D23_08465 [Rubripirellula sp.]|nr:hypothetical protein [Planctomycetaceae bacterium]MDA9858143.1 hypothetical protein [Rubripirellula sp.]MDF1840911.1 hypothetical protein [Rubripirellula sp.]
MIHYICDRCKRQINTADQTRYVIQIDIQSVVDNSQVEMEEDIDHLAELHQMLEGMNQEVLNEEAQSSHHGQYDLCPECHRQFLKNPLGRDSMLALGFSNN